MTLIQDREEACNKVLPRRFKAQRTCKGIAPMKKRAAVGALGIPRHQCAGFAVVTSLNGV
ncbi:MAG: hypothetical protein ACN6PR_26270 [Achromobacter sp.]